MPYTLVMKNILPITLLGFMILAGAGFYLANKPSTVIVAPTNLQESKPVSPTTTSVIPTPEATSLVDILKAGGSSYSHPSGAYSFLYPSEYVIDSQDNDHYIRIIKRGASQRPQSEISDGVLIVFEAVDLQKLSLEEWVDEQLKASAEAGTSQVIQPKKTMTLNGYPGFTYQTQGFGSSTYIVVQKAATSQSAVSITFLVADPQNQGYQSEVEAILATLELRK